MKESITGIRIKIRTAGLIFLFILTAWATPVRAAELQSGEATSGQEAEVLQAEAGESGEEEEPAHSLSKEELSALLDFVKEKWDAGELENEETIQKAIEEGEEKFGVVLQESERNQLTDVIQKLDALGLNHDTAIDLAGKLYEEHGDKLAENFQSLYEEFGEKLADSAEQILQEQVVEPAKETAKAVVEDTAKNFWQDLKNSVVSFSRNIFS